MTQLRFHSYLSKFRAKYYAHINVYNSSSTCTSPDTFCRQFKTHYCQQVFQASPLAPQIRLLLTLVRVYKLYLLTYLRNTVIVRRTAGIEMLAK